MGGIEIVLRAKMQHTQIANVCGRGTSFFVLGPVAKTTGPPNKMFTMHPDGKDWSSKWPELGEVKLKVSHTQDENTEKTLVYVGSKTCRRSPQAVVKRKASESKRSGKGGKWQKPRFRG